MSSDARRKYTVPVYKKDQPDDTFKFQPLPEPTGTYPFHLSLIDVKPNFNPNKIVFHMVGDTGSLRNTAFQHVVVREMVKQFEVTSEDDRPQFLYHLGDVVYNHGEADHYYEQFFSGYQHYPEPIFAIAGNHDSDVNPLVAPYKSLDAFMKVFCDTTSRPISFSNGGTRKSMTQPNVYWTLKCPLVNIIGLHSNVPKFGIVTPQQKEWLKEELKSANAERPGKALIVCIHHAPYSADINHGSSQPMIEFLEGVFEETGIKPDIVFSGHVHNYQRFEKEYEDGKVVSFIVAGAGGYDELHPVAQIYDDRFTAESPDFEGIRLANFCDDKHGFLRVTLEKTSEGILLTGDYFTLEIISRKDMKVNTKLSDHFTLNLPQS
jgi:acid phosphatase type 7